MVQTSTGYYSWHYPNEMSSDPQKLQLVERLIKSGAMTIQEAFILLRKEVTSNVTWAPSYPIYSTPTYFYSPNTMVTGTSNVFTTTTTCN